MKFEIRRFTNGAILRVEADDPDTPADEVVYQEREEDEIETFAEFLRYLLDSYGPVTSCYSPKRIGNLLQVQTLEGRAPSRPATTERGPPTAGTSIGCRMPFPEP